MKMPMKCKCIWKSVIFVKKKLKINFWKIKKYKKVGDLCHYTGEYRGGAYSICNSNYSIPKKIPIVFHNESNYDDHFIHKGVSRRFKKQFDCLG